MFEQDNASNTRDLERRIRWFYKVNFCPILRYRIWWIIHNCIIHPILGFLPIKPIVFAHDWTSMRLNLYVKIKKSPIPQLTIEKYIPWIIHNVAAHSIIGIFPTEKTFLFHDKTAKKMNVHNWA